MKTLLIPVFILALLFRSHNPKLVDIKWYLVRIEAKESDKTWATEPRSRSDSRPYLIFKDSTYYGDGGCNNFSGRYWTKKDSVIFDDAFHTKVNCPFMDYEDFLFSLGHSKCSILNDSLYIENKKALWIFVK
jgi:heat shock protein HslJ